MKRNQFTAELEAFKNKEQKGLFTFYLQSNNFSKHQFHQDNTNPNKSSIKQIQNTELGNKKPSPHKNPHAKRIKFKSLGQQRNEVESIKLQKRKLKNLRVVQSQCSEIQQISNPLKLKRKSIEKILEESLLHKKAKVKLINIQQKDNDHQNHKGDKGSTPQILGQMISPLDAKNQNFLLPHWLPQKSCKSPQYQQCQQKIDILHTVHQLKSQTIIHPEKYKPIIFPNNRKRRSSYIRESLFVNNSLSKEQKLSASLKLGSLSALQLKNIIQNRYQSQKKSNQKPLQITDQHQQQISHDFSTPKINYSFNTFQRSLLNSLKKVDQDHQQNDLCKMYKESVSNLLKRNSNKSNTRYVSQFRAKNSFASFQKLSANSNLKHYQSSLLEKQADQQNKVKLFEKVNANKKFDQKQKIYQRKRNFLQIVQRMKDRYQSI